ncbi:type VII secretion EssA family protein [uncultured Streptococcus sp.]|uniref:type VII secretion EssA family protein n=1 Tax=uncultured Streptococcus sp. TaxID=83427 RepID=UPI0028E7B635|nr:type VII secretion EssA family protein [uncultured Streptococcus sp.]
MLKKSSRVLVIFLLLLLTGSTVYAKDGELDLKTDSITQKKQRSQGNEIEHIYAPNLFMDRIEQEATKSKTDAQEMLKTANQANFSKKEVRSGDGLDLQVYRQALFQNYQVSDNIIVDTEESGVTMIWSILGAVLFIVAMILIGIYLGRIFHGGKIFKRNN